MKKILIASLVFSSSAFAGDIHFKCNKLINGNYSGKAKTVVESVDLDITVNPEKEDADLKGSVTLQGDNSAETIWSYFVGDRDFDLDGTLVRISSYESNFLLCKLSQSSCRTWDILTIDLESGEAVFEYATSNAMLFGAINQWKSIHFVCERS